MPFLCLFNHFQRTSFVLHSKVRNPQTVCREVRENCLRLPTTVYTIVQRTSRRVEAEHDDGSVLNRCVKNEPVCVWCNGLSCAKVNVVTSADVVVRVVEVNLSKILGMFWGHVGDPERDAVRSREDFDSPRVSSRAPPRGPASSAHPFL